VKVLDTPAAASTPWSTYLPGSVSRRSSKRATCRCRLSRPSHQSVWASCVTEYLMEGMACGQLDEPHRDRTDRHRDVSSALHGSTSARDQLHGDALHGADLQLSEREFEKGDLEVEAVLRGNRIRRYKVLTIAGSQTTVRLS